MQNEELDLYKILKGHEGESFYSPCFGTLVLQSVTNSLITFDTLSQDVDEISVTFLNDGKYACEGEINIFPSKNQRDWNKWAEKQKSKLPKTWSELCDVSQNKCYSLHEIDSVRATCIKISNPTPIERSALALLKIYQLIEVGYGGNITDGWFGHSDTPIWIILPEFNQGNFLGIYEVDDLADKGIHHIAFHTKEQAEEFFSYPENVQLIKDFYIIQ